MRSGATGGQARCEDGAKPHSVPPCEVTVYDADAADQEENVCTKEQVAAAIAKGWTAYQWINEAWAVYEGSDPTAIDTVPAADDIQTSDASAPAYNLSGQRINGSQKGIIIRNGRKYFVK